VSRRVGIDIVSPESVVAAIDAHGERYLQRVFTAHERHGCRRGDGWDARRLAAHVAAKEAAFKAIGVGDRAVAWTDVEVTGPTQLMLRGQAATLAKHAGVASLSLSVTLTDRVAAAIVIAVGTRNQDQRRSRRYKGRDEREDPQSNS
jgi:holo-[acyl-carrier protein] synthase